MKINLYRLTQDIDNPYWKRHSSSKGTNSLIHFFFAGKRRKEKVHKKKRRGRNLTSAKVKEAYAASTAPPFEKGGENFCLLWQCEQLCQQAESTFIVWLICYPKKQKIRTEKAKLLPFLIQCFDIRNLCHSNISDLRCNKKLNLLSLIFLSKSS